MAPAVLTPVYNNDMFTRTFALGHSLMSAMSQWYNAGHWHNGDENGRWGRFLAIPSLAATMYRYDTSLTDYRAVAIESIEAAWTWNLETLYPATNLVAHFAPQPALPPNGYLSHVAGQPYISGRKYSSLAQGEWGIHPPEVSQDFETAESLGLIIWTMDMLAYKADGTRDTDALGDEKVKVWLANCKACLEWLYDINGHCLYYSNGNILACMMSAAGHLADFILRFEGSANGEWRRFIEIYEQCFFTLHTPSLLYPSTTYGNQFTGYGLKIDTAGVFADWSDYFIHFTETSNHPNPAPTPSSDYIYGNAQMGHVARLYSITRDERLNKILNGLYNTLEARMNWTTYTMDTSGGSRQNGSNVRPAMTAPFWVMSFMSGRYPPLRTTRLQNTTTMKAMWDTAVTGYAASYAPTGNLSIQYGWMGHAQVGCFNEVAYIMHSAYQARTRLT